MLKTANIEQDFIRPFRRFSSAVSILVISIGVLTLFSWIFDVNILKNISPNAASVKPNTAICFIFLGTALWLQVSTFSHKKWIFLFKVCVVVPIALGGLTLIQYLFNIQLKIDELLFLDTSSTTSASFPGRMAHATALNIVIFGVALWLLSANSKLSLIASQWLALIGSLVGFIALVAYLYGVTELYGVFSSTAVPLAGAVLFFVFGLSIFCAQPTQGLMTVITNHHFGGAMVRRVLPLTLTLPLLTGWLRLKGQQAGLYDTEFGLTLFATSNVLIFSILAWWNARDLNSVDEERRQIEDETLRLAAIIKSSEDAIIGGSLDGKIITWNPGAEKIFGYSAKEIKGLSISKLIPLEQQQDGFDALNLIKNGGEIQSFDAVRLCKDGSEINVNVRISAIKDASGNVVGVSKVVRDISARKRAEDALQASEEQFRTMVNAMSQLAWMANSEGFLYWYNQRWFEYTGTTAEQMAGWGWQTVHDPVLLPKVIEAWKTSIATGAPFEDEFPLRGADGVFRWFLTRAFAVRDDAGNIVRWVGTNTDISEKRAAAEEIKQLNTTLEQRISERTMQLETANKALQHSQAELNSLFESLPGLYLVLTPSFNIVTASDAYLAATMTTREAITGRHIFDVFPDNPDDLASSATHNLRASLNHVLQRAEPHQMAIQKYDIRRPDGVFEEHYWSPINSPVFGGNRQLKYIVHRVEDITEFVLQKNSDTKRRGNQDIRLQQMEAEVFLSAQKLLASNQKLEMANKELEAFSYSVSHDLRAPLRHIDGFIGVLEKSTADILDAKNSRYLKIISDAAKKMSQLIDDLLSFSRMTRVDMMVQEVNTSLLVEEIIKDLTPTFAHREIHWQVADLPKIRADKAMIKQVFVNLLSNAIKYTKLCETAEITIGAEVNKVEVIFFITDNGVGFDMQYIDKLFGVFQRLHASEDFEGTGIGLANVRRIVQRHGGQVRAVGKPGLGATFYFSIPNQLRSVHFG